MMGRAHHSERDTVEESIRIHEEKGDLRGRPALKK